MALRNGRDPYKATYGIRPQNMPDAQQKIEDEIDKCREEGRKPDAYRMAKLREAALMQDVFNNGNVFSAMGKYRNPY